MRQIAMPDGNRLSVPRTVRAWTCVRPQLVMATLCAWLVGIGLPVVAHEGHDHGPAVAPVVVGNLPRLAQRTDLFELAGGVRDGELRLWLSRAADNRPVSEARVSITLAGRDLPLTALADGSFQLTHDALRKPGRLPLVVTVDAGDESDLIQLNLDVPPRTASPLPTWAALAVPRRQPDGRVLLPKAAQHVLGVLTSVVERQRGLAPGVELAGRVVADPASSGRVQAPIAGRIEAPASGFPLPGMAVRRGTLLGWLVPSASALERGQQEALVADLSGQLETARQKLNRLRLLVDSVPRKDLEAAEIEVESLTRRLQSSRNALGRREPLLSPVEGVVSVVRVGQGQLVEAREPLFEVVNPKRLLVETLVSDPLQAARLTRASLQLEGDAFELPLAGRSVTLREQALPVLFRVPARVAGRLAVGQAVRVIGQQVASAAETVPVVPDAAVLADNGRQFVWLQLAPELFERREVRLRPASAGRSLVLHGLGGDERIVSQGVAAVNAVR